VFELLCEKINEIDDEEMLYYIANKIIEVAFLEVIIDKEDFPKWKRDIFEKRIDTMPSVNEKPKLKNNKKVKDDEKKNHKVSDDTGSESSDDEKTKTQKKMYELCELCGKLFDDNYNISEDYENNDGVYYEVMGVATKKFVLKKLGKVLKGEDIPVVFSVDEGNIKYKFENGKDQFETGMVDKKQLKKLRKLMLIRRDQIIHEPIVKKFIRNVNNLFRDSLIIAYNKMSKTEKEKTIKLGLEKNNVYHDRNNIIEDCILELYQGDVITLDMFNENNTDKLEHLLEDEITSRFPDNYHITKLNKLERDNLIQSVHKTFSLENKYW